MADSAADAGRVVDMADPVGKPTPREPGWPVPRISKRRREARGWSGPWSLLQDPPSIDSVDSLCMELQVHPACVRLWEEFLAFFGDAQRKHGLARWTVDLELHCEATSRTSTPSANLHAWLSTESRANPYVSAEAPRACGHSTFDQGHYYQGKLEASKWKQTIGHA